MCFPRRSPVPATVLALVLLATVGSSRAQGDSVQETEHPVSVRRPVARQNGVYGNDSGLSARSNGLRFSTGGQYALARGLGLYGRIGLRTGQHVMEIGFLPDLWAGVAFEF